MIEPAKEHFEYRIVTGKNTLDLEANVTRVVNDNPNWLLQGGVGIWTNELENELVLMQAMITVK